MSPVAALGLVLLGIAILLSSEGGASRAVAWVADAFAAVAALLGLVRLSGYLLGFDPGLDHLLFARQVDAAAGPPSRVAFQSALNLLLVGAALLLQRRNTRRAQVGVQLLAVAAAVVALVGVTAHAYGTRLLYGAMSLNTAVAFLIAAAGLLWCRPDRGFAALVASPTPGGALTRRLLPAIIVAPLLLGWLRLAGQGAGLYDTAGGTALFAVGVVAVLAALAWWSARSVDRADAKRRAAEQMLRAAQARLQQVLGSRTAVIYGNRVRGTSFSPSWMSENITAMMGYDVQAAMWPGWRLEHV